MTAFAQRYRSRFSDEYPQRVLSESACNDRLFKPTIPTSARRGTIEYVLTGACHGILTVPHTDSPSEQGLRIFSSHVGCRSHEPASVGRILLDAGAFNLSEEFFSAISQVSHEVNKARRIFVAYLSHPSSASWLRWEPSILQLHDLRTPDLASIVLDPSETPDISLLSDALRGLCNRTIPIPLGKVADSLAIGLIKRILEIDFEAGWTAIKPLIRPDRDQPFRFGYFQVAITGSLIATIRTDEPPVGFGRWIWQEVERLRTEGLHAFEDRYCAMGLLSSLIATGIMAGENTPAEFKTIERAIQESAAVIKISEEKGLFFRSLADSLNLGVTPDNLPRHFTKLLVFIRNSQQEPSAIRKNNVLLNILAGAREALASLAPA